MIPRLIEKHILLLIQEFPVIAVTGPRQSGKTTLIKEILFPKKPYVNLEDPRQKEFATTDPAGFLEQFPEGACLDEVQQVPHLFSYIQVIVDEKKRNGLFVLSGSHHFLLMKTITQSLAGRVGIAYLLPLSLEELSMNGQVHPNNQKYEFYLKKGFYPKVHAQPVRESVLYSSYCKTYIERDVRLLLNIKDYSLFQKFMGLCAGRIGQLLNKDSLARDIGVSSRTVEEWLSVLEASFVLFRLTPYFENIGKRLVKSPKLYFFDVGLACYLLNIDEENQLLHHPLKGNLFENMQVVEAIKHRWNLGKNHNMSFYRDSNDVEIDIIFEQGQMLHLIEVKSSKTFHSDFLKNIESFQKSHKNTKVTIVYGGNESQKRTHFSLVAWNELYKELV